MTYQCSTDESWHEAQGAKRCDTPGNGTAKEASTHQSHGEVEMVVSLRVCHLNRRWRVMIYHGLHLNRTAIGAAERWARAGERWRVTHQYWQWFSTTLFSSHVPFTFIILVIQESLYTWLLL